MNAAPSAAVQQPCERPHVDLVAGSISYNGKAVRVSRKRARIAAVYAAHFGAFVETRRVVAEVYGKHQPVDPAASIWELRRGLGQPLSRIGLEIVSAGKGVPRAMMREVSA